MIFFHLFYLLWILGVTGTFSRELSSSGAPAKLMASERYPATNHDLYIKWISNCI